jgi:sarcosine oxidase subunit gamma
MHLSGRSALHAISTPGTYGARHGGEAGVVLSPAAGCSLAVVTARRGKQTEAAAALGGIAGVEPKDGAGFVARDGITLLGCAPGQWVVVAQPHRAEGLISRLEQACKGAASLANLSAGKEVVRISGARARDVLAKGCTIDLSPRSFKPGDAAVTRIGLIDAMLWQVDDAPTFAIAIDRSIAASFWSWLAASAAAYGYEVK